MIGAGGPDGLETGPGTALKSSNAGWDGSVPFAWHKRR